MWLEPLSQLLVRVALCGANDGQRPAVLAGTDCQPGSWCLPFPSESSGRQSGPPAGRGAIARLHGPRGALALYAQVPPTQQQFLFRAGSDGEYWFAHSHPRPFGPSAARRRSAGPGFARAGRYQTTANRGTKGQCSTGRPRLCRIARDRRGRLSHRLASGPEPKGSVAIAINPAIGSHRVDYGGREAGAMIPGLPPASVPADGHSRLSNWNTTVDRRPPGIGRSRLVGHPRPAERPGGNFTVTPTTATASWSTSTRRASWVRVVVRHRCGPAAANRP